MTLRGESAPFMEAAIGFMEDNAIVHTILATGLELLQTIKKRIEQKTR